MGNAVYRVDAPFGDETRVVMFGESSYTLRANGEMVTTRLPAVRRFSSVKAVNCVEVFDSAEATAKASMLPWSPA